MGYRTKQVLFLGVRNKFCTICCRAEKKGVPAREHRCGKNWEGPSTAMEADIILDGFMASQEMYGLKYTKFIGDGDSSVFKVLYESMPYGRQEIQKIECRNHIVKNYTNRIINEIGSVRGKDRSTSKDRAYVRNQLHRLRAAVIGAINYRKSEDGPLNDRVKKLAADILNGPHHVFGDHTKCAEYFCNGSNEGVLNQVEMLTSSGVFQEVMMAVNLVAEHAPSLIHDCDSNVVEHLNSIVAKMVGGKRINYCMGISYQARCEGAVVSVNTGGKLHSTTYMEECKKSPGVYTKKAEDRKRRENEKRQERRALTKRQRSSLASADEHYGPDAQKPSTSAEVARRELFLKALQRTPEEIEKLEAATRGQNKSDLWVQERKRLLTASNFGKIMNMKSSTDPKNKVKEILNIFRVTSAMKHGQENEKVARKAFENKLGVKVDDCGLFVDVRKPFLGATPDGRVGDEDILEIKCPCSAKNEPSVREAVKKKVITYLEIDKETGEMRLKPKNNYYYQVQGQLHITGKRRCYFVVWIPNDMFIQVIEKDDEKWMDMIDKLEPFYMNYLLPELVKKFPPRR